MGGVIQPKDSKDMKLKNLIMESFTEVHFTGTDPGANRDEVRIQYDDNFDPIRAYVYKNSPLVKRLDPEDWEVAGSEELAKYRWRWKQSPGSAMFHINRNVGTFVWWIKELGYVEHRDI